MASVGVHSVSKTFRMHREVPEDDGKASASHRAHHYLRTAVLFALLAYRTLLAVLTAVHFISGNNENPRDRGVLNMWLLLYAIEAGAYSGLIFENFLTGMAFLCARKASGSNIGIGLGSAQWRLRSAYFATAIFSVIALITLRNYAATFSSDGANSAFEDAYTGHWGAFATHSTAAMSEGLYAASGLQTVFAILSIGGLSAIAIVLVALLEHAEQALFGSEVHEAVDYKEALGVAMGYGANHFSSRRSPFSGA